MTPRDLWGSQAEEVVKRSLFRARAQAEKGRRRDAENRRAILEDDWRDLLVAKLRTVYQSEEIFNDLLPLISTEHNAFKRIVKELSTVYQWGALREWAGADQNALATMLYEEADVDATLEVANLYLNGLRDLVLIPQVVDGRMRLDVVTPERLSVIQNPQDPTSIVALFWERCCGQTSILPTTVYETLYADEEIWRVYDTQGRIVDEWEHGLGGLPAIPVHAEKRLDSFWMPEPMGDVVDATFTIGILLTLLLRLQKWQSEKQITFSGPISDIVKGTALGAHSVLGTSKGAGAFSLLELQADPEFYIKGINARLGWIAQQHGMAADVYTLSSSASSGFEFRLKRLPLLEQRAKQIKIWTRVERQLWPLMAKLAQREHPLLFRVDPTQPLTVRMHDEPGVEDPLVQQRVYREAIADGMMSQVDALMDKYGLTREQAFARAKQISEERAIWIEQVRAMQTAANGAPAPAAAAAPTKQE